MKFTKTMLDNGLRIITVPLADNQAVTVLVMVEAGSKYETKDISGLSHFLEHMCFKGTQKRPTAVDMSRELDSIGAQYNAFTSQEYTGYYAKAHKQHLDTILDVIADMYINPTFPEKEIEKEKGVIIEEINMYEDMPHRHVQDLIMQLMYGDQPAGWNIAGTRERVAAMTRDHFVQYRSRHYLPQSTTIIVSGGIDEKAVLEKVTAAFTLAEGTKDTKVAVREEQHAPALLVQQKKTDQVHMVIGVRAFGIHHNDTIPLRVLNAILGGGMSSRLFQKLRDEMGVGYYVRSGVDEYTDHGMLAVMTGVDTKRVTEVVQAIMEELKKLRDIPVSEAELQKAKDFLVGNMYLELETSDALAMFYGMQDVLREDVKTPDDMAQKIAAVTALDVERVAKTIFVDTGLNAAFVGTVDEEAITKVLTLG